MTLKLEFVGQKWDLTECKKHLRVWTQSKYLKICKV